MKVSRVMTLVLVTLTLLAVSVPSYAGTCYKCSVYSDCLAGFGTASACYSYGTSCLTTGRCDTGEDCTQDCWYEQAALAPSALATEYQLADVKIEHFKETTAEVAVGKVPTALLLR